MPASRANVRAGDDRRRAAAGVGELAGILFRQRDQLGYRIRRNFRIDHQHEGQVAGARDRGKILDRIVAHVLEQIRIGRMRRIGRHEQRVAVGRGAGHVTRRDRTIGAGLVVDHGVDAERRAEFLADQARRGVGAAAGCERQHQRDVAVRVAGLRESRRRQHEYQRHGRRDAPMRFQ